MAYYNLETFLASFNRSSFQKTAQFRCRLSVENVAGGRLKRLYPEAARLLAEGLICESTRTPSRAFDTTNMTISGYEEKYPIFTTYTDVDCTFMTPLIVGERGSRNQVLELFNTWQNLIQPRTERGRGASTTINDSDMVMRFPDYYRLKDGMVLEMFDPYSAKRNSGQVALNLKSKPNINIPLIGKASIGATFGDPDPDTETEPTIAYRYYNVFPSTVESSPVGWSNVDELQKITVSFTYSYWASDSRTIDQTTTDIR
jgi:hypothetical protein